MRCAAIWAHLMVVGGSQEWAYIRADKKKNISGKNIKVKKRYTYRPEELPQHVAAAILAKLKL